MALEIRVLVADDSAVIRTLIRDSLAAAGGMKVVGSAHDGQRALELLDEVWPDVVTLDVQMPRMDGLAALEAILARRPVPVIMVSSMTKRGAAITLEALELGALDYLAKPDYGTQTAAAIREELPRKIRRAAGVDVRRVLDIRQRSRDMRSLSPPPAEDELDARPLAPPQLADKCIAIGISTGGPPALTKLFAGLRPPMPPIVVVQHMPPSFTGPLAWRLDSLSQLSIKEAVRGDRLVPNHVLIAPGGKHLEVRRHHSEVTAVLRDGPPVSGHKPSVDVLMTSVAKAFGKDCVGVIMTGMGRDGAEGCRSIRAAGGYVLGQDEASSEVYGMNKVAYVEGNVDSQFSLDVAPMAFLRHVQRRWLADSR